MKNEILRQLRKIEKKERVEILYAIESGSRAWGFESKDSDYDVRFIYAHPKNWYLSIDPKRDVIEMPLEGLLDFSGWDITKTLHLFRKSNPPLYEWLQSPIVYVKPHESILKLKKLMGDFFSLKTCLMHYFSMADHNYKDYAAKPNIKQKKYFYVLRPILACSWIIKYRSMPPMEFEKLLGSQKLSSEFLQTIDELLKRKRGGLEQDLRPRIKLIDVFIEERIDYFRTYTQKLPQGKELPYEPLNRIFRGVL